MATTKKTSQGKKLGFKEEVRESFFVGENSQRGIHGTDLTKRRYVRVGRCLQKVFTGSD